MIEPSSLNEHRTWPLIARVGRVLREHAVTGYVVGGWVRDSLLGREADDIDFAVEGDGLEACEHVAKAFGGKCIALDRVNRVARLVMPEDGEPVGPHGMIDVASLQGGLEDDLARRDFTINAMAIDISDPERAKLIDPSHGLQDLASGTMRAGGDGVFASDPVRLVRVARFAATLGFAVEPVTEAMIRRDAHLVAMAAGERIREELLLLLAAPGSGGCLAYLQELGLLTRIFPELEATRGVTQPLEHYWDVLDHSIRTVESLEYLLRSGTWPHAASQALEVVPWSAELAAYFDQEVSYGSSRRRLFKLAALLHDIAKPQTRSVEASGKVRFLGHGQAGAIISERILERLRFSVREIRLVETAIKHHLRPTQMGWPELPTRRAAYRYFRDTGEAAIGILFLSLADHLATRGPTFDLANWHVHVRTVAHVLSQELNGPTRERRLIDGYDIMKSFSLGQGPRLGEILEATHEAQAAGEITTREEALALVKKLLGAASDQEN